MLPELVQLRYASKIFQFGPIPRDLEGADDERVREWARGKAKTVFPDEDEILEIRRIPWEPM